MMLIYCLSRRPSLGRTKMFGMRRLFLFLVFRGFVFACEAGVKTSIIDLFGTSDLKDMVSVYGLPPDNAVALLHVAPGIYGGWRDWNGAASRRETEDHLEQVRSFHFERLQMFTRGVQRVEHLILSFVYGHDQLADLPISVSLPYQKRLVSLLNRDIGRIFWTYQSGMTDSELGKVKSTIISPNYPEDESRRDHTFKLWELATWISLQRDRRLASAARAGQRNALFPLLRIPGQATQEVLDSFEILTGPVPRDILTVLFSNQPAADATLLNRRVQRIVSDAGSFFPTADGIPSASSSNEPPRTLRTQGTSMGSHLSPSLNSLAAASSASRDSTAMQYPFSQTQPEGDFTMMNSPQEIQASSPGGSSQESDQPPPLLCDLCGEPQRSMRNALGVRLYPCCRPGCPANLD